jgi:hypothetical protein
LRYKQFKYFADAVPSPKEATLIKVWLDADELKNKVI